MGNKGRVREKTVCWVRIGRAEVTTLPNATDLNTEGCKFMHSQGKPKEK